MTLTDRAEEIMETMWITIVENEKESCDITLLRDDYVIKEVRDAGLVTVDGHSMRLTESGHKEAKNCIRRHRLAERLLADVLDVKQQGLHDTSCKFEHLLHEGLEENICTLLGHPRVCPHGHAIPEGECCRKAKSMPSSVIMPLSELGNNQKAKIAYLHTSDQEALQKIIAIGALPNTEITMQQAFPSIVFKVAKSQFAIDKELAKQIYVRRINGGRK